MCYVGFTTNYTTHINRILNHTYNPGNLWLQKYPILEELCTIRNVDLETEHELADYLMRELGHGYIRGGAYTRWNLKDRDLKYFLNFKKD